MSLQSLTCSKCGAKLPSSLKCEYCGTQYVSGMLEENFADRNFADICENKEESMSELLGYFEKRSRLAVQIIIMSFAFLAVAWLIPTLWGMFLN